MAKSEIITSSTENLTEEQKIEMEETKGGEFDGLPQIEETKGPVPQKKKVLHNESDEEDDSFVHCDPNIQLGVGEEDEANLTGQLP